METFQIPLSAPDSVYTTHFPSGETSGESEESSGLLVNCLALLPSISILQMWELGKEAKTT